MNRLKAWIKTKKINQIITINFLEKLHCELFNFSILLLKINVLLILNNQ